MTNYTLLIAAMILWAPHPLCAHGGGTIRSGELKGCHQKTSDRTFHCHSRSKFFGRSWPSKSDAIKSIGLGEGQPARSDQSTTSPAPATLSSQTKYNRQDWAPWQDFDSNCRNTRTEVLLRDNIGTPVLGPRGCKVIAGQWTDFYTQERLTDPKEIEIDHVVSVKQAHDSGGDLWPTEKKKRFYNDPDNLVVSSRATNRSKGANDFRNWLPKDRGRACAYALRWLKVKRKYSLEISAGEVKNFNLLGCGQPAVSLVETITTDSPPQN